ncbi:MAG: LamG domain-containing protein, partial [bacterium]|nr:LamG domain-containing protein [bacterium]
KSFTGNEYLSNNTVAAALDSGALAFGGWVYADSALDSETWAFAQFADMQLYYDFGAAQFGYADPTITPALSSSGFGLEQWYHVVLVIDGSNNGTLYVNGQSEATFSTTHRPAADDVYYLGDPGEGDHEGWLDNMFVFNRALSPSEVSMLAYYPKRITGTSYPLLEVVDGTKLRAGFDHGIGLTTFTTPDVLTPDAWNHVAATFDGTSYHFFVNGVDVYSDPGLAGQSPFDTEEFVIGLGADASSGLLNFFQGQLDDLRIYRRALDAVEIQSIYARSGWDEVTLQGTSGDNFSTWSYPVPDGLEGLYQVSLRGADMFSNTLGSRLVWAGTVDNTAPRISLSAQHEGISSTAQTTYDFSIQDFFLSEENLALPCTPSTLEREYFNSAWLRTRLGQTSPNSSMLFKLSGSCLE